VISAPQFLACTEGRSRSAGALHGEQFGDLLGYIRYGVLFRAQPVAGAEERADRPNLVVSDPIARQGSAGHETTAPRVPSRKPRRPAASKHDRACSEHRSDFWNPTRSCGLSCRSAGLVGIGPIAGHGEPVCASASVTAGVAPGRLTKSGFGSWWTPLDEPWCGDPSHSDIRLRDGRLSPSVCGRR
jgi:hypothetical protein